MLAPTEILSVHHLLQSIGLVAIQHRSPIAMVLDKEGGHSQDKGCCHQHVPQSHGLIQPVVPALLWEHTARPMLETLREQQGLSGIQKACTHSEQAVQKTAAAAEVKLCS